MTVTWQDLEGLAESIVADARRSTVSSEVIALSLQASTQAISAAALVAALDRQTRALDEIARILRIVAEVANR